MRLRSSISGQCLATLDLLSRFCPVLKIKYRIGIVYVWDQDLEYLMIRKKQSKYSDGLEGPNDPFRVRTKLQGRSLGMGHVIPIPL